MKQYTPEELNKLSKEEIVALLMQSQKEAALFKERLEELQMHLFGRSTERMEWITVQHKPGEVSQSLPARRRSTN